MGLTGSCYDRPGQLIDAVELFFSRMSQGGGVLAVGDLMLDRFISGRVERISPEGPIPILTVAREANMPGGVGNVVANIRSLGGKARVVAVVGEDDAGRTLAELLGPAEDAALIADPGRHTVVKERFVAGGQQLLRADYENSRPLSLEIENKLVAAVEDGLTGMSVLVLSDYGKGVLSERVAEMVISAAHRRDIVVIADPKGKDYTKYRSAHAVTPNLKELGEAAGAPVTGNEAIVAAANALMERCGIQSVVATRGGDGLSVIVPGGEAFHIRASAREVFDVSGAGDTVVAVLALAVASGMDMIAAAAVANLAAGVVVGKVGTATVTEEELRRAAEGGGAAGKIMPLSALTEQVERWRRRGFKVGFTNGCFDLLHPGHLSLLRQARAASDRLVVGLNSDASVKRLKGADRPVSGEAARAAVLAAVGDVDAVVVFEEDTPRGLIEALRPDVLVKGADYTVEQIVGADIVQSYGGKIVRAVLEPGHSTTAVIAKMARPTT